MDETLEQLPNLNVVSNFENSVEYNNAPKDKLAILEENSLWNDGKRGESYRNHIHWIVVIGMYFVAFLFLIMVGIWVFHLICPSDKKWLTEDKLQGLERLIFSSVFVSFASKYFKKYKIVDNG